MRDNNEGKPPTDDQNERKFTRQFKIVLPAGDRLFSFFTTLRIKYRSDYIWSLILQFTKITTLNKNVVIVCTSCQNTGHLFQV